VAYNINIKVLFAAESITPQWKNTALSYKGHQSMQVHLKA